MLDQIKDTLRLGSLTVYDSAEKIDICKAPYVVCYDHGVEAQPGTKGMLGKHIYEVVCLVPYTDVSGLPALEGRVRGLLREVPGLRFTASGGTGVEQTYQARALALTYTTCERL